MIMPVSISSRVFGSKLDIHSGGIDLKFPHHENEIAQSCSFHQVDQWANYWMHTGNYVFIHFGNVTGLIDYSVPTARIAQLIYPDL